MVEVEWEAWLLNLALDVDARTCRGFDAATFAPRFALFFFAVDADEDLVVRVDDLGMVVRVQQYNCGEARKPE